MSDEVKQKKRYVKQPRDYNEMVGVTYNYLTVLEILPRTRNALGELEKPMCRVQCECGNTKVLRVYDIINNNIISCGCKRGIKESAKEEIPPPSIIEALGAKYFCKYTTNCCVRSKKLHLCCVECDRFFNCSVACESSPDQCGALIRAEMKKKDLEDFGL